MSNLDKAIALAKGFLVAPSQPADVPGAANNSAEGPILTEVKIDPGPGFPYVPLTRPGQPKPEPVEGPREVTTVKLNQEHFRGFLDRISNVAAPKGVVQ
jgi:hypothetical protein